MKFIALALMIASTSAFAFNTHTVGNDIESTREPSSVVVSPKK
jgi:hypothetical protein